MRKHKDTDYLFLSSYLHAREARAGETGSETDKAAILRDLESLAPDPKIVDFFRVKYDYHNAKVFLKSIAANTDNSRLYSPMGRLTPEQLRLHAAFQHAHQRPEVQGVRVQRGIVDEQL